MEEARPNWKAIWTGVALMAAVYLLLATAWAGLRGLRLLWEALTC